MAARDEAPDRGPGPATPGTILLIAAWIGLAAGFVDLALMVLKQRLIGDHFHRLGAHFPWLIPAGVAALLLMPTGIALAIVARLRRGGVRLGAAVGLLAFVGSLDMAARLPLEFWASLLLCGGLAAQAARLSGRRPDPILRWVRRTLPVLAASLLAIAATTFGLCAWAEWRATANLPPPPPGAPNVLLIVWDTVRAANLGLHGYRRPTTPNLERLAARGVRFDRAFATAPWTLPSHSSLFTGRWPHEVTSDWQSPLDATFPTLAEYLASRGYDTAGFVANLDYCSAETGLGRGFAHYEDYPLGLWDTLTRYVGLGHRFDWLTPASVLNRLVKAYGGDAYDVIPHSREHAKSAEAVDRAFLAWLSRRRGRGRPFFAFLNENDAHSPYEVPDRSLPAFGLRPISYADRLVLSQWDTLDKTKLPPHYVQMATDLYDECIRYLDRRLGVLLDEIDRLGVLDDTMVIVASDHGEHLGDHRLFFHGCSLYRQLVGVPLVIAGPEAVPAGRVVAEPVSLRDVPATVTDLLGLADGAPFPGRSLGRFWDDSAIPGRTPAEPILMEAGKPLSLVNQGREPVAKGPMKAMVADGKHYIRRGDGREELYLLNTDPDERDDLAAHPAAVEILRRFRAALSAMLGPG